MIDFTSAYPNSRKVYDERPVPVTLGGEHILLRVPVREVALSGGEPSIRLYDTSGPQGCDVRAGLPPLRRDWIMARSDVQTVPRQYIPDSTRRAELPKSLFRAVLRGKDTVTQLHYARKGMITPEMEFIAAREGFDAEFVRSEVARGRAIATMSWRMRSTWSADGWSCSAPDSMRRKSSKLLTSRSM